MAQNSGKAIELFANAKINLCLSVLSRRADGYHELDMLMHSIGLSDTVTLRESDGISLHVTADEPIPEDQSNLAFRAALLLQSMFHVRRGVSIDLVKRIPSGAGLGGGSADAAAVLFGLNRLWDLQLSSEALGKLSVSLGADVPFCLLGGLARVRGIGEKLTSLTEIARFPLVIVKPDKGLWTASVFSAYDAMPEKPPNPSIDAAVEALSSGETGTFINCLQNALQPPAISLLPEIGECILALQSCGALAARMTGSGSAVFGLFSDLETAQVARDRCLKRWKQTHVTTTVGFGVEEHT